MSPVAITLKLAAQAEKPLLQNLMQLYLYDFSEFDDTDVDEQGLFHYPQLPRYWQDSTRYAFLVRVEGQPGGFALVRRVSVAPAPPAHMLVEFFIMRKYRRHGVGTAVAYHLFDRFPGQWLVAQIQVNRPAQHFWRRVIHAYTGGDYHEEKAPEGEGPIQIFTTPAHRAISMRNGSP
jgi:predicted acetyltransferase